ncbi:PREDICTED: dual specificity protein phosphatase PHS1-like isoform X2 [Populus euphratica]|uniref:Dual specificity protein phosphatase PHS1-like isoform X2 n=1 Tax=Populus euphratica TaxID=75702 RepID=A0AAJ6Y574_POPEU|nr:PREDICTED: dual specificity protein phosphatase PHS1-like isoform X2 [Populus euphratica]
MLKDEKEDTLSIINTTVQVQEEERELDLGSEELDPHLPLTVTSRVLYMLGDITAGPAYRFAQWLELVRKRSDKYGASGFPRRPYRLETMPSSVGESLVDSKSPPPEQVPEVSLWERLGKAVALDIESSSFSWDMLSSLHHTEHGSSTENSEDEMSKALEVTVNSGGVVFFALFNQQGNADAFHKESAAVIKFSSSRMATQSERLGYEFAKCLGVQTPQARVVQNCSPEWLQIKEAAEKARVIAASEGDEVGIVTCSELLEALELSRCLLLMSYVHGSPLLESSNAFEPCETGERIAAALGRVFLLDLVIRNEDRLPCRQLRWRGNPANLLLAEKMTSSNVNALEVAFDSAINRYRPKMIKALQKERRATSLNSKFNTHNRVPGFVSQGSDVSDITESPKSNKMPRVRKSGESLFSDLISHAVAIDSGVPRRPPAEKRTDDQANYPKLIELLLNSSDYTSNLLYEVTGGKLGAPPLVGTDFTDTQVTEMVSVVKEFRGGFRAALRDLQGFHVFLLTLHQKLDGLLRVLLNITNKTSGDTDREDLVIPKSPSHGVAHYPSPPRSKENSDSSSPMSRESWHGKLSKGSGEPLRSLCLMTKLREILKFAKVDTETNEELEHWNEMLRNDAIKLCQENNFNTGYFEGSDSNCVVDAYELKVRLEHILERISLISEAANTEKPSLITNSLFIGGTLAARSVYTLQNLGITHILCLCANEIGQSESQHPDLFQYKNFSISDHEDSNISSIFGEASDFIDHVESIGGRVVVHCFEGRSRSATLVLAYLMLRKKFTLLEAWNALRRAHRRAQPNDGFAKALLDLDRQLHGKVSMEWQRRKPEIKVCPVCGDNAGLSSSSLKLHLQKSHKKLSSGSVDSAMTMEIQKVLDALKMTRGGSVSPTLRQSSPSLDG